MKRRHLLAASAAALVSANSASGERVAVAVPDSRWRFWNTKNRQNGTWPEMINRLSLADVVFAGEFHDDPQTHKAERLLLESLHTLWRDKLSLAMEMFGRDGQTGLNDYLAGKIDEEGFRKAVRLWPNYASDYRPMIEFARDKKIPVHGSNAPGPIVKRVGKEGLAKVTDSLTATERPWIAATVSTPRGDVYDKRFAAVMGGGHGGAGRGMAPDMVRRFYEAQCVRDDTMAETVTRLLESGRKVLHINGSFHSDAGLGTAQRVLWRRPLQTQLAVVKIVPVKGDTFKADVTAYQDEAHFVVFVPDERPASEAE
jgi:uncharacterized iron-regulated protein